MLALLRNFDFKATETFDALGIYEGLLGDLRVTVAEQLGVSADDLPRWPVGEWSNGPQRATGTEWRPETVSVRLLEFTWQDQRPECHWNLHLSLGCGDSGNVTLGEVWNVETSIRALPFESLPNITQFLVRHEPRNADGYVATQARYLTPDPGHINAFRDYILSPTRTLPVVVVAPRARGQERTITGECARDLMGLAVVVRIEPAAQDLLDSAMDPHFCSRGSIRLYMPGYQTTDRHRLHPFWSQKEDIVEAKREITFLVARESVMLQQSPLLEGLRARRNEQDRSENAAARERAWQEASARLKAEQSIEAYEDYIRELMSKYEELQVTNQTLRDNVATLETNLGEKEDEIRQLRWRVNQSWGLGAEDIDGQPAPLDAAIMLSRQTQGAYNALDEAERDYWDRHLFPKLLDPEYRENQTRPVKSKNKPCFVYPSSRTGDGRRIIYYCEDKNVHICEIFTGAEHDRYEGIRSQGFDRSAYDDFVALREIMSDAVR